MTLMNKQYSRHARDKWYAPEWAWWRELPNDARALYDFLCDCREAAATLTGIFQPPLVQAAQLIVEQPDAAAADRYLRRLLRALEQAGAVLQQPPWLWVCDLTQAECISGSALAKAHAEADALSAACPLLVASWMLRYAPEGLTGINVGGRPKKPPVSADGDGTKPPVIEQGGNGKPGVYAGTALQETGGFEHDNNAQLEEPPGSSLRSDPGGAPRGAPPASLLGEALPAPPQQVTAELLELAQAMLDGLGGPRMTLPPRHGAKPLAGGMVKAAVSVPQATAARWKLAWLWGQGHPVWRQRQLDGGKWLKGPLFVTLYREWEAEAALAAGDEQGSAARPVASLPTVRPALDRDELGGRP